MSRLGSPASHGCVRLSRANAATLYALVQEHGVLTTTVTLTGSSQVALARTHETLLVDALAHPQASREAAVAAAAHRALVTFYPAQAMALDTKLTASLAAIPDGKAEDDGVALGRFVADQVRDWHQPVKDSGAKLN